MKSIVTIHENTSFKTIESFSSRFNSCEIEHTKRVIDQEDYINLSKIDFDDNIRRESRGPVWDKPVQELSLCFCPNFEWFC